MTQLEKERRKKMGEIYIYYMQVFKGEIVTALISNLIISYLILYNPIVLYTHGQLD